ncbi:MAG: efflux RND transporter periplasmic adaptor subunit [Halioglobus sp.]
MRKRSSLTALTILVLGGALAYGVLVGKPGPAPAPAPEIAPTVVDIVTAQPTRRALEVETQGTVRPLRQIRLMSQVGGRVEQVSPYFAQGGFFAADEVLVKIEDVDYQLQIARAESRVAAAKQTLAEEKGRALQARREWRDLGTSEANALFLRKPQIAAAEASLAAAEADLKAAQLDLERTRIAVPFNGRISEKLVDIGQFVAPGTHVATVYATDAVEVRLPLTGRQVALLDLPLTFDENRDGSYAGARVVLSATFANRQWNWQGRVVRTDASIDENSRVLYAVAEVEQPFAREEGSDRPPLSPGLFVNATIAGRELDAVSELPRSVLGNDGAVLVVDNEQRVQSQAVRVLGSDKGRVWLQGLQPEQRVILRRPQNLVVGMPVTISTTDSAASNTRSDASAQLATGES